MRVALGLADMTRVDRPKDMAWRVYGRELSLY